MKNFFEQLRLLPDLEPQTGGTEADIVSEQESLKNNGIAQIPQAYIDFLHLSNGLIYNGAMLFGIYSSEENLLNITTLNLEIHHPLCHDLILLGQNEMDYLGYNQKWKVYQIIDKDDFEVLDEYQNCIEALKDLLKI